MTNRVALEHLRKALWEKVQSGALRGTALEGIVLSALRSTNLEWLQRVFRYISIEDIAPAIEGDVAPPFLEPSPAAVTGEIFLGATIPSGIPVHLRISDLRGHMLISGQSQTGKSTLTKHIVAQLLDHVAVTVFDIENEYRSLLSVNHNLLVVPFSSCVAITSSDRLDAAKMNGSTG